jgi:hypothetical protein
MTTLMEQEKQRISERLARLDAEREKLSGQLDELEIAERVLARFGERRLQPRRAGEHARQELRQQPPGERGGRIWGSSAGVCPDLSRPARGLRVREAPIVTGDSRWSVRWIPMLRP